MMELVFTHQSVIVYVEINYVCMFTQWLEIVINYLIHYDLPHNRCLC